ncbi:alanine--tRNA ligase, partial [Streptomyces sp. tea 10]|nr:alanine--tRNA ligase [Streptomyces sp. tea 10]
VQSSAELPERLAATLEKLKETERQLAGLRQQQLQAQAGQLAQDAQTVGSVRAVLHDAGEIASADALRTLALDLRARLGSDAAVAAVTGVANGRPLVVVAVNDAARDAGLAAGQLVRTAATALGGGGGGKPDVA